MQIIHRFIRWIRIFFAIRRIRRAKSEQTSQTAKQTLAHLMADNRGLTMKVGQVMAGMQDDNDFVSLTRSVEAWPLKSMIPIMEKTWQCNLHQILKNIDESQAAASLGQVHHATLLSGEHVAIKLQYPDISKAIHSEINLLKMMPSVGPVKRWGFDLEAYKKNLHQNMQRELNYQQEMQHQLDFSQRVHVNGLHIPKVYPALSHQTILVQEWVGGVRLQEVGHWPLIERLSIARTLISTLFQSLFSAGLIHGDPHPGNLLYQRGQQPTVTLLDFGCMIHIEPERRIALLKLILSLRGECEQPLLDAFVALGFDAEKLSYIQSQLPKLAHILFRPFIENKACDVEQWHPAEDIETALGEQRWWFRAAGPADLFLLMRVFQGLVQQLHALNVQLPWWPLLKQSLSPELIIQARQQYLPTTIYTTTHLTSGSVRYLKIKIHKQGEAEQILTFDAIAALHLEALVPAHIQQELHHHDIDIKFISQQLREQGLKAKFLFDLEINHNHYSAWVK